jgi:hypothetical protein
MLYLFYALGALKIWMLVDAVQRGAAYYWFCIIVCMPFGSLIYFFMVKAPELGIGSSATRYRPVRIRQRPADLEQLRYQFDSNPCLANQALLASGLYDAGEHEEAMEHYRKVLRRDERYQRALYGLSLCHIARGEHTAAVERLSRLLEENRGYADYQAWLSLAGSLAAAGEWEQAVEALEGLVKACPRLDHVVELANALIEANRSDEARAHLEQALLDYDHSPRHVKRQYSAAACQAQQILSQIA